MIGDIPFSCTTKGSYGMWRSTGKSFQALQLPLFLAVACTVGCRDSDRNMLHDRTRNSFEQLALVIVAVHGRDPTLLKESALHNILTSAVRWGYLSQGELDSGRFEQDGWGNAIRISYGKTEGTDVFVMTSPGPKQTTGRTQELSLKIVFRQDGEPQVSIHGFP